ncbi:protein a6 [Calliphora vicina]|uniref:protein a6 n=1 Tax=Calliphora vicina TaxID=7373 RepID=UPI00325B0835
MAPKVPEKQHTQQQPPQQHHQHQQPLNNNSIVIKHSNPFHISAYTLCHNKRLKLKRSKYGEYLRNAYRNNRATPQKNNRKTEVYRQNLHYLQADVTIDLLSDDEAASSDAKNPVSVYPERMCLERAAILGLMPVERAKNPPPLVPISTNQRQMPQIKMTQQPLLLVSKPQQQPRKRKSRPQKRRSLPAPPKTPILMNSESIVLSDDSNDVPQIMLPPPSLPHTLSMGILQPPDLSVTCPTSSQIPCLPQQNTMQVDEEVTISLVPRSLNATACASRSSTLNTSNPAAAHQEVFPMLPDETTVHTVIANRIYELSLTKLREGLASCGIPEFADGQQKISPQRRKGMVQQPPVVSPPQAPISLKLSSDLSISLISDDEDETRHKNRQHEPILSPAFLQKLPVNVSIAPVPMRQQNTNHTTEPRKLKLG